MIKNGALSAAVTGDEFDFHMLCASFGARSNAEIELIARDNLAGMNKI